MQNGQLVGVDKKENQRKEGDSLMRSSAEFGKYRVARVTVRGSVLAQLTHSLSRPLLLLKILSWFYRTGFTTLSL